MSIDPTTNAGDQLLGHRVSIGELDIWLAVSALADRRWLLLEPLLKEVASAKQAGNFLSYIAPNSVPIAEWPRLIKHLEDIFTSGAHGAARNVGKRPRKAVLPDLMQ